MKKCISVILLLCFICTAITGCAGNNDGSSKKDPGDKTNAVDLDLTVLSSTMVYAEVNNMMANPDDYMGKTMRINGLYFAQYYEPTELFYHYVVIEDATACCAQGLEFVWNGGHVYPDDYPEIKDKVEVIGVFESYDELGKTYYFLSVDEITILA